MRNSTLKNQPCYDKDGNFLGWFSRSVAVVVFVFRVKNDKLQVMLEKRGKGCPDNVGKWCSVCGYLEFDETIEEAAAAEAFEETGFIIDKERLFFEGISSDPKDNHQNVSVRFCYYAKEDEDFDISRRKGGEKDEVDCIEWLTLYDKATDYTYDFSDREFAFDHDKIIKSILTKFVSVLKANFY